MPSFKHNRTAEDIRREITLLIRELKDPRIAPMTTVVDAVVATDLKTCKVYISVLGDEKAREDTMAGLKSAEGYVRRELAHSLNLRNTPQITFLADRSIERGVEMSRLIDEVCGKSVENEETE